MQKTTGLPSSPPKSNFYPILIIGILFFIFGFVTWLNGTLIPFLKITCELRSDTQAFLVVTASYMAYFFLALPSATILKYTGYKKGMSLGLMVMVAGTLLFLPAADQRSFGLFLTGLFIQGAGLALLQTASNPYISILGPIESAAKRISIMGICNKVAGAISPLILGTLLLSNIGVTQNALNTTTEPAAREKLLEELASRIHTPYIIMAIVLVALAIMIYRSALPEIKDEEDIASDGTTEEKSIFSFSHLWLGVICIFLYVGAEVMAGDAIGIYGNSMGMPLEKTKYFTSFTLTAMLIGYIIGIITIPKYLSQQTALKMSALLGLLFTIATYFTTGYTAITMVAMLGLANALMWPAIFPLAINGLGSKTKTGAALLIMGIAGGAIIPLLFGELKSIPSIGFKSAFLLCLIPSYAYILYYAQAGHKPRK
ncbi:sugar MFS transporter [Flavihumibacter stibioxidans]|uniref:Glucose/galactose MFS transporter n=1 Tax=Flavihumibacter stibioxidans TaxID=1834163 RepID=A0ABR7M8X9_9BACT|nr:sugar MFS transporter [Flavihumibacter stibioxidans]MBC6491478.1 glucose/galactose MFS transporter [Flavihumibacter stibioxidans]